MSKHYFGFEKPGETWAGRNKASSREGMRLKDVKTAARYTNKITTCPALAFNKMPALQATYM